MVDTSFRRSAFIVLHFPARPSWSWLGRHILLLYVYTRLWRSWLLTRAFLFNNVPSTTHFIFYFSGFSVVSDLDTLKFGALLHTCCLLGPRSTIEGSYSIVSCFRRFLRGSKVVWGNWGFCFRKTWSWVSVLILPAFSLLSSVCFVYWTAIG